MSGPPGESGDTGPVGPDGPKVYTLHIKCMLMSMYNACSHGNRKADYTTIVEWFLTL